MTEPVEMCQPHLLAPLHLAQGEQRARPGAWIAESNDVHFVTRPPSSVVDGTVADGGRDPTERGPPAEHGMPELISDLAPGMESLAALLVADRDRERNR